MLQGQLLSGILFGVDFFKIPDNSLSFLIRKRFVQYFDINVIREPYFPDSILDCEGINV